MNRVRSFRGPAHDLKPSNVMVGVDGRAYLLDFGIAKLLQGDEESALTQDHGRALTLSYAAPEQIAGEAIGVQADVYSLGVLLYELLTGVLPYEPKRRTLGALEEAILEGDAPLASHRVQDKSRARVLRGDIDAILGKALKRGQAERYPTAQALGDDIERYLSGEAVSAKPDGAVYRVFRLLRRHWIGAFASASVFSAIVIAAIVSLNQAKLAREEASRALAVKTFMIDIFGAAGGR